MSDRTWLYAAGLVVALAMGGFLLQEPVFKPYHELATRTTADRAKVKELKADLARRQASRGEASEVLTEYGGPLSELDRHARATLFYRRVESMVTSSGLEVVSLQPKPEQMDATGVIRFPVVVSVTGDLKGVVSLLAQARATSGLIGVERLTVRRRDDEQKPLSFQAILVSYGVADRETRDKLAHERERSNKKTKRSEEHGDNPS